MKTAELTGAALDWAVAVALEVQFGEGRVVKVCRHEATTPAWLEMENSPGAAPRFHRFGPSTDWAQGGPIIDREKLALSQWPGSPYAHVPNKSQHGQYGATPLIAAMRCYVASKLGDDVPVPAELTNA